MSWVVYPDDEEGRGSEREIMAVCEKGMVGNRENKKRTVPWNIGEMNWVSLYVDGWRPLWIFPLPFPILFLCFRKNIIPPFFLNLIINISNNNVYKNILSLLSNYSLRLVDLWCRREIVKVSDFISKGCYKILKFVI